MLVDAANAICLRLDVDSLVVIIRVLLFVVTIRI